MDDYERIVLVKSEVFVYRIPPLQASKAVRAAEWKLDNPDWVGRLRVVTAKGQLIMKFEDKTSGELFAKAPIDKYPGVAIQSVADSSRYFVVRLQDENGRSAFIGIGFADRGDSFDMNVALQDHFKDAERDAFAAAESLKPASNQPKLDLAFKSGQTITLNLGKSGDGDAAGSTSRPRSRGGGGGAGAAVPFLPPPPSSGARIAPPPGKHANPVLAAASSSFSGGTSGSARSSPHHQGESLANYGDVIGFNISSSAGGNNPFTSGAASGITLPNNQTPPTGNSNAGAPFQHPTHNLSSVGGAPGKSIGMNAAPPAPYRPNKPDSGGGFGGSTVTTFLPQNGASLGLEGLSLNRSSPNTTGVDSSSAVAVANLLDF